GLGDEPASPVQIGHQADPGVQRPVSYRAESRSPHAWWGESSGPPAQAEPRVEPEPRGNLDVILHEHGAIANVGIEPHLTTPSAPRARCAPTSFAATSGCL